jgi:hypothetical protein
MLRLLYLTTAFLLLAPSACFSTPPWRPPVTQGEFFSENGQFVLVVDPSKPDGYTVFRTDDREVPLWSFSREPGFGTFLVSNDGQVVVDLTLPAVGSSYFKDMSNPCLQFWTPKGKIKVYRIQDLCTDVSKVGGWSAVSLGGSSNWYRYAWPEGDVFRVWTCNETQYTFSFTTAEIVDVQSVWLIRLRQGVTLFCAVANLELILHLVRTLRQKGRKRRTSAAAD